MEIRKELVTAESSYDTLVETLATEWYSSMVDSVVVLPDWEVPKYSKKQIDKAGKLVANAFADGKVDNATEEFQEAIRVLNNWRSSHAYPLEVIADSLRKCNPGAIVVQRLKRLDSIVGKIKRFPTMSLYRMQDLGGCRIIVGSVEDVYRSIDKFKSLPSGHILKREDDYIQCPKSSGYRGCHLVYQFQSEDTDAYNKNILIEVQFRTKLQHIWATAIEVMGIYTKSQLKSGFGDVNVLRFFVLVSSLFAKLENTPVCPDTVDDRDAIVNEIREINSKMGLVSKIGVLSFAINSIDTLKESRGKAYYVLILNYAKMTLYVKSFTKEQIGLATEVYNQIEARNDKGVDVVLVSASSFDELRKAYPNYFVDIREFVRIMKELLA